MDRTLAVIGLGKLGLPLAALQAQHHRVFGVDLDAHTVKMVNAGRSPIIEPYLPPLLKKVVDGGSLSAHTEYDVVTGTDMSLVIVPTPSNEQGVFTTEYVVEAVRNIGAAVAHQANRHVVVICSTVMPGQCDAAIRPALEAASGKTVGENIGLIYSPEFIALGSVISDMKYPAVTLIGESDEVSGKAYLAVARAITNEGPSLPPFRKMSLASAEITKIALNAYVTMKISFANTLGEICESVRGADAQAIADAIGLDPRVGKPYIRPGGPFGGPCFPRDNRAFAAFGESVGVHTPLAVATDEVNDRQVDRIMHHIERVGRKTVGVMGLTYKAGAPIFEESFGMKLAVELHRREYVVKVYDPFAIVRPQGLPDEISWNLNPEACFGNTTTTVLTLPDSRVAKLLPEVLSADIRTTSIIIDVWDFLPPSPWDATHIIRLGKGP